ncbi:hypothetical protein KI387_015045, partial [Taxus chinensis]
TVDEWRDLIRRVCTDSLMIPMDRTRTELSVDAGEPFSSWQAYRRLRSHLARGQDGVDSSSHRVGGL